MNPPTLPPIPAKRYFTVTEVSELCDVKPHVLRYWEQEFTQLRSSKPSGARRYYQRHELHWVRRIRELLLEQGLTLQSARQKLQEPEPAPVPVVPPPTVSTPPDWAEVREKLLAIRKILTT